LIIRLLSIIFVLSLIFPSTRVIAEEANQEVISIIEDKERTIYEYRHNGVLMMIKIQQKNRRPYYMVPADGEAHYSDLSQKKHLYPQWVILEW
jgi:hypothetical protein